MNTCSIIVACVALVARESVLLLYKAASKDDLPFLTSAGQGSSPLRTVGPRSYPQTKIAIAKCTDELL